MPHVFLCRNRNFLDLEMDHGDRMGWPSPSLSLVVLPYPMVEWHPGGREGISNQRNYQKEQGNPRFLFNLGDSDRKFAK